MQIKLPTGVNAKKLFALLRTTSYGVLFHFINEHETVRCFNISGQPVWIKLMAGKQNLINFSVLNKTKQSDADITQRLEYVFGTKQPIAKAKKALLQDTAIAKVIKTLPVHTIVQGDTLFETLFIAILGQQISVAAARSQRLKVISNLGKKIKHKTETIYALPTTKKIINCDDETFRRMGVSRQKARYLREAATWFQDGRLDIAALNQLDDEQVHKVIRQIPGVGRWTAEIVLMRSLGRPDVFPAADIGLQNMAKEIFAMEVRPTEKELLKLSELWKGWRSYAAFYLWTAC